MGWNDREIEQKLVVENCRSRAELDRRLKDIFDDEISHVVEGFSTDYYWKSIDKSKADFIRVRFMPEGWGQMTLKHQDKGTIGDRVEIDVEVNNPDKAIHLLERLYGKPAGEIKKRYTVLFLENDHVNVSTYRVVGDDRVFLEIEAKSKERLVQIVNKCQELGLTLTTQTESLYKMFIEKRK